ncbi:hypothetical protein PTTG_02139 [Puccinia triticina 1-1 BBBD Race 1]|uniref:RING-type domain-containing protein n=1 Tax=Puccinia triticina (isolate 1-1 / race 1 (BBBD)) TaxID=630390 RepID=A0A180GUB3_PUCT1|nr:hypothetical protein PTTG_02139 [Puccinia triticina 1-1 BBBD Race 1]
MATSELIVLPTCTICRDEDATDLNFGITKCGHAFHSECMEDWDRNQVRLGRMTVCPCCNANLTYARPITIRLHQLVKQRVIIIPDGEPDPVEELKTATKKVEKLEADKAKLAGENRLLKAKITNLIHESEKATAQHAQRENVDYHPSELEKERQLRKKQLHAFYQGEQKRLRRQLEDSKEAYENIVAEFEPVEPAGLTTSTPADRATTSGEQMASGASPHSSSPSNGRKRSRPLEMENEKGKAPIKPPTVIDIDSSDSDSPVPPRRPDITTPGQFVLKSILKKRLPDPIPGPSASTRSAVRLLNSSANLARLRSDPFLASLGASGRLPHPAATRGSGSGSGPKP